MKQGKQRMTMNITSIKAVDDLREGVVAQAVASFEFDIGGLFVSECTLYRCVTDGHFRIRLPHGRSRGKSVLWFAEKQQYDELMGLAVEAFIALTGHISDEISGDPVLQSPPPSAGAVSPGDDLQ